jgi:two-component system sensor histidine kinase KdpD
MSFVPRFSKRAGYSLAVLAVAATTALLAALQPVLDPPIDALIFLLIVGIVTSLGGLGPGIVSSVAAFLAFNYFFLSPRLTLIVHQTQDVLALIAFLIVAVAISQLVGRAQSSARAASAREREATQLYELSLQLAGLHDDRAIAQTLGDQVFQTVQADRVEVAIEARSAIEARAGDTALLIALPPAGRRTTDGPPPLRVPLQTTRGEQGEIRVWRAGRAFEPAEERLLRTSASQAAMAIERARLAGAANRSEVLEESDRLKSALLSSVSHELRTPLATIKAAVTSLRTEAVPWDFSTARDELLAAIEEETDYLNQLVGNLLDMSRIESGALHPQRRWNALAEIAGSALSRLRAVTHDHRLTIDFPDDLPLISVDYVQIEQVFRNLISNSAKYAPANTEIRLCARVLDPAWIHVQVSNQGPPVPDEHLERIFDKFYRVTAADRVTGTGLGLSICKGIIEAHGGRIWAENAAERFIFNFTLPLTTVDQRQVVAEPTL